MYKHFDIYTIPLTLTISVLIILLLTGVYKNESAVFSIRRKVQQNKLQTIVFNTLKHKYKSNKIYKKGTENNSLLNNGNITTIFLL